MKLRNEPSYLTEEQAVLGLFWDKNRFIRLDGITGEEYWRAVSCQQDSPNQFPGTAATISRLPLACQPTAASDPKVTRSN